MDEVSKQETLRWRVKVYLLNEGGNWDEGGTGDIHLVRDKVNGEEIDFFQVVAVENDPTPITVSFEKLQKLKSYRENENYVLYRPLLAFNVYEKQGDNIISWIDKEIEEEIAVSFLDPLAAKEIWRTIWLKLGKSPHEEPKRNFSDFEKLPMPTAENLNELKNCLESNKEWAIYAIMKNPAFLDKLFQVFKDLEDLESLQDLQIIHDIMKILIFTDDHAFLELLLSDEYYLLVFGALEYDSAHFGPNLPKYRDFLKNQSYYKKVIEFKDPNIVKKIHLNFRLSYLRDSVIGSIVDELLTGQFNTVIYYNNQEIFDYFMRNPEYMDQLFANFFSNLKDSVGFLFELVQIVKVIIKIQTKEIFCEKLVERGIFNLIGKVFAALKTSGIEDDLIDAATGNILKINLIGILYFVLQSQINTFIDFLKNSPDARLMIDSLIDNLFNGDQGLQIQITELFKYLTDSPFERKTEILDIFYGKLFPIFLEHFQKMENDEKFFCFVQQYMELLVHCVKPHGYRFRHYFIHHKLLHELYKVLNLKEKSTSLAVIRLVKSLILSKDDYLIKYITRNNLLDQIFDVYLKNARKDNLLTSACLDFFNVLQKEKNRKLIYNFGSRFKDKIYEAGLENTFQRLLKDYEELDNKMQIEGEMSMSQQENESEFALPEDQQDLNSRELKCMEEEDYFELEEEKKEDKSASHKGNGIYEKENKFLTDYSSESDTNSEADLKFDNFKKIKNLTHKKIEEEEEEKVAFHTNNKLSRVSSTTSIDKIANKIDIQLNLRNLSEDNLSATEDLHMKRIGSDLDLDDDIREESKIETLKRVKS